MIAPPPLDPALRGLRFALDGSAMRARLAEALKDCVEGRIELLEAEPIYVRYKPATSCLVSYRVRVLDRTTGAVDETSAQLRLYADDHAARIWAGRSLHRLVARAARRHPQTLTDRAALLDDVNGIVQIYPVDRALPQLVRVAQRSKAGRLLAGASGADEAMVRIQRADLIRYRPGRKALFRYTLRLESAQPWGIQAYAKTYADDRAPGLDRLARRLRLLGVPVPEPIGASAEQRTGFQAAAPGAPLLELRGGPTYADALDGVVEALARLHAVMPGDLGGDVPVHGPDHGAWLLGQAAEMLATLLPGEGSRIRRLVAAIAGELDGLPTGEPRPIHGDFYDDQVLVGDAAITLLDFDEMRLGDPLTDAGNFLGHVSAKLDDAARADAAREAFLASWAKRSGGDARVPLVHEAASLILMAVGPFRRLEADWPAGIRRHLDLAEQRLVEYRHRTGSAQIRLEDRVLESHLASFGIPLPARIRGVELLRNKPGRRSTTRCDLEVGADARAMTIYAKRFVSGRAARAHAALVELNTAIIGPRAPRLPAALGCVQEEHLVVIGEVPGEPAPRRLAAGDVALAGGIADALHALHASSARLPRTRRLSDEFEPLAPRVERLSAEVAELEVPARSALAMLRSGVARDWGWRSRPLHRDFYPDQVLVDGDGIAFIDLDDAAMGEPALDVANFVAHLRLLALREGGQADGLAAVERAFLRRYAALDPDLDPALVRFLVGATCLRLAEIHVRRPYGAWLAHHLIEETHRCLPQPLVA